MANRQPPPRSGSRSPFNKPSQGDPNLFDPPTPASTTVATVEASSTPSTGVIEFKVQRPEPMLAGATRVLKEATGFAVTDAGSYADAATRRAAVRAERDSLEARRIKMKEPVLTAGREIDGLFQPPIKAFEEAAKAYSDKMTAYDTEQKRIAEAKQREADAAARREQERLRREAEAQRERTEMALSELKGIQQQAMIAQAGRLGVRKGGTLECIRETLAETRAWVVTEEKFGQFYEAAKQSKATVIFAIEAMEKEFLGRQEAATAKDDRAARLEAEKARQRAEAETKRIGAENDRLRRESEANVRALEEQAASTVAKKVEVAQVEVAGLTRSTVWKWRIKDKSKLRPEFLLIDEKTINKLVVSMKDRAHEVVGDGAIEIYQDQAIRQDR